ncbi:MAG TPA: COX15/CtaA family protein [Solirubrobacteraceae bacterium]|nr:COX15/CtaA family protein [Solirubrobacteraceae bacterium]
MHELIERARARTDGFTVTPSQYLVLAYVALGALTLIVWTGAAVRLSGSGLGCPTWPKCYGSYYPPLNSHAVIEFSNRLITGPVVIAAGLAWVGALRRRPYRRDLVWLSGLLPLGVIGQAVLGGLTVKGALDYGWVMGHFALSMLILVAAVLLVFRASRERESVADTQRGDRALVRSLRALVGLGALAIFAGTAATAAGPHGGGSPGQKINRLSFDGRGTMDFVIHRHAEIALVFGLAAVAVWWLARRREAAPGVQRPLTVLCVLLAVQGAVGLDQYETHLPTELVWVHVALASCCWVAAIWSAALAGALLPRRRDEPAPRPLERPLVPAEPLRFPGN